MSSLRDAAPVRAPMSPCISICALGLDGHCSGCLRTRDEIAGWLRMTPSQQWTLLAELDRRRNLRAKKSDPGTSQSSRER